MNADVFSSRIQVRDAPFRAMLAPMAPGGGQSKAGGAEGAGRANSRRRQRAVRLLGAAALGCATLAALALPPRGNPRVDSAARSYWGPGAPAWWSRFPVAAGAASAAQRRLQAKALGSERQRRLQTGLGQQHEQQQHAAAPPALLGNRAAQTGNGTATAKSISAARVADRWLHARPSSGAAGHWEWIPASRSHLAPGLYHASDRDAMPFRNGVYTHQHAWDTDGLRKQWDTGDSARAYVCLGVRASVCVYVCVCVCVCFLLFPHLSLDPHSQLAYLFSDPHSPRCISPSLLPRSALSAHSLPRVSLLVTLYLSTFLSFSRLLLPIDNFAASADASVARNGRFFGCGNV